VRDDEPQLLELTIRFIKEFGMALPILALRISKYRVVDHLEVEVLDLALNHIGEIGKYNLGTLCDRMIVRARVDLNRFHSV
jgi:hypothetical protein